MFYCLIIITNLVQKAYKKSSSFISEHSLKKREEIGTVLVLKLKVFKTKGLVLSAAITLRLFQL